MTASDLMRIALSVGLLEVMRDDIEVIVESTDPDLSLDKINDMIRADHGRVMVIESYPQEPTETDYRLYMRNDPSRITKFQRPKRGKRK